MQQRSGHINVNKIIQYNSETTYTLSALGQQPYPAFELRNIVRYLDESQNQGGAALLAEIGIDKQQLTEDYLPADKILAALQYYAHHLDPSSGPQTGQIYPSHHLAAGDDTTTLHKDDSPCDAARHLCYSDDVLDNLRQKNSLVNDIQQILVSSAGDYPDIEMLAGAFKVSSRTLRRQLSNLGTSYQKILNKVRCQLSIEYLTRTGMSIENISSLIGFNDATNFRHAFKKWVGKTPSIYRKAYQA